MKKSCVIVAFAFWTASLAAQRQYDYYDDNAVAGGADRVLNILIIISLLAIGIFVLLLLGGGYYKIKYWLNPQESPEYKAAQKKKIVEEQRLKEEQKEIQRRTVKQIEKEKEKRAIDLGLSVSWADSNVFESIDSGRGAKFSWGDIEKRIYFRYVDAILNKKDKYDLKKILGNDDLSICGNEKYDASKNLWGDNWRLPQKSEFDELIKLCEWEWTAQNGLCGYKVIGKNGNSIFLPVTGEFIVDKINAPLAGFYWSGNANSNILGEEAHYLFFDEHEITNKTDGKRWHGMAIRPVWSPNKETIEQDGFTMSLYGTKLVKCNDVEDCHIPYGVKVIAKEAFKGAKNIKKLFIPNSVEEIDEYAFSCLTIESVYIPKSVNNWGVGVFSLCTNLKKVIIENGLPRFGHSMFSHCSNLKSIKIPNSITYLPDCIFEYCENLKTVELPSNLNGIGDSAFYSCEKLQSIIIPNSVVGIRDDTFGNCENLSNVTIQEGLVALLSQSFCGCTGLSNFRIPATLQYIDIDCFGDSCHITLEVPKGMASYYRDLKLEGVEDIIEYDTQMPYNIDVLKEKCEAFISVQKHIRDQKEYEFRKAVGLMTKDDYEEEHYFDIMDSYD